MQAPFPDNPPAGCGRRISALFGMRATDTLVMAGRNSHSSPQEMPGAATITLGKSWFIGLEAGEEVCMNDQPLLQRSVRHGESAFTKSIRGRTHSCEFRPGYYSAISFTSWAWH